MCMGGGAPPSAPPQPDPLPPPPSPVNPEQQANRSSNKRLAALAGGKAGTRKTTPLGLTDDTVNATKKAVLGV